MANRRRWWLAAALLALAGGGLLGGYALLTEERVLFECTACLASDPGRCARSSETAARFGDEESARTAAVESLCASLSPSQDVAACARSPRERFQARCTRSLKRVPLLLFHVE